MASFTLNNNYTPTGATDRFHHGIATRAIEALDGWRGQVLLNNEVLVETEGLPEVQDALDAANNMVRNTFRQLFGLPLLDVGLADTSEEASK